MYWNMVEAATPLHCQAAAGNKCPAASNSQECDLPIKRKTISQSQADQTVAQETKTLPVTSLILLPQQGLPVSVPIRALLSVPIRPILSAPIRLALPG